MYLIYRYPWTENHPKPIDIVGNDTDLAATLGRFALLRTRLNDPKQDDGITFQQAVKSLQAGVCVWGTHKSGECVIIIKESK